MPHYLEFDGMSVEKAIETACKDLKISKDNLKYDIVSYGSSGIFGLVGVKKAKIKVTAHDLNTGNIKNEENKAKQNELPPAKKEEDDIELKRVKSVDEKIKNKAVETGLEALNKIISTISDDAVINVSVEKKDVFFDVESEIPSVIIGKKGQTLEAIQYLIEKIVNKNNDEKFNIKVDVGGYLNKRHEKLKKLAEKIAEKSKTNGKPMSLGQMNANDRRIIHLYLKDNNDVKTHSVGEGFIKKLVIYPRKKGRAAQPEKQL
ncbi:MAG: RNA-binding cell elongation regulator Jag/EloR [Pseudomonadota bacterium]|nr:Jag N-terminal domain-containing protein [Pseudomonadota bacterium]